jgi:DNA mismatch repair protein MutS2
VSFDPGDHVHVAALGKGVVREVRNGGRYLVELKGRSIVAAEAQLTGVSEKAAERAQGSAPASGAADLPSRAHAAASLDLHGMTVAQAVAALDSFLDEALLAGRAEVRVIHGRGGGLLKRAVHARLKQLPGTRGFRVDPRNPGMTVVSL